MLSAPTAVYRPRNPQSSDYYRCVEAHFETFVQDKPSFRLPDKSGIISLNSA
jgi:hypothetical protein